MEAIKATRQNFAYVLEYVVKDAPWAADLENIIESNLAKGEWTYVYSKTRGIGADAKTIFYHTTGTKFNEIFEFTNGTSPWLTTPITKK